MTKARQRLGALFLSAVLIATAAYAGTSLTFNGTSYTIPALGDASWGTNVTNYLIALSTGTFQKTGGLFTLTNEANFGATYGLNSAYFKSRTVNPGTGGAVRLGNADTIDWRNNGNTADLQLSVTTAGAVQFGGISLADVSSAQTLTNKSMSGSSNTFTNLPATGLTGLVSPANGGTGVANNSASTLTISGSFGTTLTVSGATSVTLPTTGTLSTLAGTETLTNKTLTQPVVSAVSNGGVVTIPSGTRTLVARDTTDTLTSKTIDGASNSLTVRAASDITGQLPIANGGTNAASAQAAINNLSQLTTKGDIEVSTGSNTTRLAVGADGTVLSALAASPAGLTWITPLTNPMTTAGDIIVGGSAGAATRLAKGATNGNVLTISAGAVSYGQVELASSGAVHGLLPGTNGGTGISSSATFPASGVVVTEAASETLTNKTLTSPTLTTPNVSSGGMTVTGDVNVSSGALKSTISGSANTVSGQVSLANLVFLFSSQTGLGTDTCAVNSCPGGRNHANCILAWRLSDGVQETCSTTQTTAGGSISCLCAAGI